MPAHDFTGSFDVLRSWLSARNPYASAQYQVLVLSATQIADPSPAYAELKTYLESAHADARAHFHDICRINLHPRARGPGATVEYPNRLDGSVRSGLFGEALCGLVAESWLLLSTQVDFTVPVFLFRFHSGVEEFLNKLLDGGTPTGFAGRHGDDFLAVELDEHDEVVRILVGEAKFRTDMGVSPFRKLMVEEIPKLSDEPDIPLSITKLIRALELVDAARFETVRASLEAIHLRQRSVERVDMMVIVYENHQVRTPPPYASTPNKPAEHSAARPLVIVELHLPGANMLMSSLYPNLYR